ncbi:MAG TPA: Hsp20 family protein [Thermohalobaculum sp.]|nr:Hsp20 family protein [Thermohalobaculum sp.]
MRTLDLSPLYRSTVGFDRFGSMLDQLLTGDVAQPGYPPYNIEKTGEDAYRITLAVAGFGEGDLNIEVKDQGLTVTAKKRETTEDKKANYLYRGIAERGFERRFQLADHMKVTGAGLENGLLHIDVVREVPEALKPRTIAISSNGKGSRTIEA